MEYPWSDPKQISLLGSSLPCSWPGGPTLAPLWPIVLPKVTKTRLVGPPRGRGRPVAKYHRQRELERALDLLRQTPNLCLNLAMLRFVRGPLAITSVHYGYQSVLPCKAEAREAQGGEIQLPGQRWGEERVRGRGEGGLETSSFSFMCNSSSETIYYTVTFCSFKDLSTNFALRLSLLFDCFF